MTTHCRSLRHCRVWSSWLAGIVISGSGCVPQQPLLALALAPPSVQDYRELDTFPLSARAAFLVPPVLDQAITEFDFRLGLPYGGVYIGKAIRDFGASSLAQTFSSLTVVNHPEATDTDVLIELVFLRHEVESTYIEDESVLRYHLVLAFTVRDPEDRVLLRYVGEEDALIPLGAARGTTRKVAVRSAVAGTLEGIYLGLTASIRRDFPQWGVAVPPPPTAAHSSPVAPVLDDTAAPPSVSAEPVPPDSGPATPASTPAQASEPTLAPRQ